VRTENQSCTFFKKTNESICINGAETRQAGWHQKALFRKNKRARLEEIIRWMILALSQLAGEVCL
jgi:hypothetical protein